MLQENYFFILLGFGTNPSGGCATGQTGAEAKLVADAKAAVETNRVAEERASAEAAKVFMTTHTVIDSQRQTHRHIE